MPPPDTTEVISEAYTPGTYSVIPKFFLRKYMFTISYLRTSQIDFTLTPFVKTCLGFKSKTGLGRLYKCFALAQLGKITLSE